MGSRALEDFVKYAKELYGCDVYTTREGEPESFVDFFGASFLNDDKGAFWRYPEILEYDDSKIDVDLQIDYDIKIFNIGLAA